MAKIRRVFHLLHLKGHIFQMINEEDTEKRMTLYSILCDSSVRVTKQIQGSLISDCGLKFGINRLAKIHTFTDMIGTETELYTVIVDIGNSVRTRTEIDNYIGKWTTIKNVATPESRATEWVANLKMTNSWTLNDILINSDEKYKLLIENNKVVDPI